MSYNLPGFQVQFNPDGGDLGRAAIRGLEPLEFSVVLPHVAIILEGLYNLNNSRLPYVYAFEFNSHTKRGVELVMLSAKLPEHVEWYETDGSNLFVMRGSSGGVIIGYICYLVTKGR